MKRAGWNLLEKRTLSSVSNERWHLHGKVIVVKVAVQQPDFSFLTSVDRPPALLDFGLPDISSHFKINFLELAQERLPTLIDDCLGQSCI